MVDSDPEKCHGDDGHRSSTVFSPPLIHSRKVKSFVFYRTCNGWESPENFVTYAFGLRILQTWMKFDGQSNKCLANFQHFASKLPERIHQHNFPNVCEPLIQSRLLAGVKHVHKYTTFGLRFIKPS
jgi:hypothetical protein